MTCAEFLTDKEAGLDEIDEFIAAYMKACKKRAPDHNEVGYLYFRAAWIARGNLEAAKAAVSDKDDS